MTCGNMDTFGGLLMEETLRKGIEWVVEQFIGNKWFYGGGVLNLYSY